MDGSAATDECRARPIHDSVNASIWCPTNCPDHADADSNADASLAGPARTSPGLGANLHPSLTTWSADSGLSTARFNEV